MAELDIAEEMTHENGAYDETEKPTEASNVDSAGADFAREVKAHADKASSMIQHVRERAGLLHDMRLEVTCGFMKEFQPKMPESLRWTTLGSDIVMVSPSAKNESVSTLHYANGRTVDVDNEWLGYEATDDELRTWVRDDFLEAHMEQTVAMARKHEERLEVMRRLLEDINTSRYIAPVSVERAIPEELHTEFSRLLQPYPDPQALKVVLRGLMAGVNDDIQYLRDFTLYLQDMQGDGNVWYQFFRSMTGEERKQYDSLK